METFNNIDTILLRRNNHDYFFKYLTDYSLSSCYKEHLSVFEMMIRKLFRNLNEPCSFLYESWKYHVKSCKRVIIFDMGYEKTITKYIKKINPLCTIHVFFFNTIKNDIYSVVQNDKNVDYIWTFDRADAKKYGFRFNTPMYTYNLYTEYIKNVPSVVFVGAAKSREEEIMQIQQEINKAGIKTNFRIVRDKSDYIKYDEYLSLIRDSNCILDVTNEGQTGLTLRFMEALFLSKKLITNNKDVLSYPFYNQHNIFILGYDPLEKLGEFLTQEYHPIKKEIILYYDFDNWVKRFIEVEK